MEFSKCLDFLWLWRGPLCFGKSGERVGGEFQGCRAGPAGKRLFVDALTSVAWLERQPQRPTCTSSSFA